MCRHRRPVTNSAATIAIPKGVQNEDRIRNARFGRGTVSFGTSAEADAERNCVSARAEARRVLGSLTSIVSIAPAIRSARFLSLFVIVDIDQHLFPFPPQQRKDMVGVAGK